MRVISRSRLVAFWQSAGHELAEGPLRAWFRHVSSRSVAWRDWADVKGDYPSASHVGDCVVFNIGGNKFRLIVRVRYATSRIYVLKTLTHKEYDRNTWQKECGCFERPARKPKQSN